MRRELCSLRILGDREARQVFDVIKKTCLHDLADLRGIADVDQRIAGDDDQISYLSGLDRAQER